MTNGTLIFNLTEQKSQRPFLMPGDPLRAKYIADNF